MMVGFFAPQKNQPYTKAFAIASRVGSFAEQKIPPE